MKKRIAITTLGCKVNQYESAAFICGFLKKGMTIVPFSHHADIYVVNSCAITTKAAAQSRQLIRRALRNNKKARLVVTGCYAQIDSQNILDITDQPICLVGNDFKHCLVEIALTDKHCDLEMCMGDISRQKEFHPLTVQHFTGRTRSYLKVQDGCNQFCSYCIVPFARGRSRSLPLSSVLKQAALLTEQGYKEMVITGIHLGDYGNDLATTTKLPDLLTCLLQQDPLMRYRLSSLAPTEISEQLLQLMAKEPTIMPYLHISLQSGDDQILDKMRRRYRAAVFDKIVKKSISIIPNMAIGVDVLVGFPGEDEQAFANTFNLLKSLPVTSLHVFPYSRRPGTAAASMKNQVSTKIKITRAALLRDLDQQKRTAFYNKHLGKVYQVLAETSKNKLHKMRGFTENYIPVYFDAPEKFSNQLLSVKLEKLDNGNVFGCLTLLQKTV